MGPHLISYLLHQQVHLELQDLLELLDPHKYCHHLLHLHPPINKIFKWMMIWLLVNKPSCLMITIRNAHIPKVNLRQDWWKPLEEEGPATPEPAWSISSSNVLVLMNNWASALVSNYLPLPEDSLLAQTGDIAMFMDCFCKRRGITKLKPQDLEGSAFEIIKVFHPNVIHLQYQMEECHKLLTNNLEYLRYDRKGSRPVMSISKMKATYYPDVGLEQMVPDQMWIEEECKYDIATMYSISHWWFQRQRFYIDRHTSKGDRRAVRTHMQILNVVRIEVFSMYGYDYMKKIVLRHADLNEHVIAE
nr:hypothetical protein [Tanacetum cinerariifolium]